MDLIGTGYTYQGHILYMVTRASILHATPANVLVPLKDVNYEGNLKMVAQCTSTPPRT